jgi:hypothetical protein
LPERPVDVLARARESWFPNVAEKKGEGEFLGLAFIEYVTLGEVSGGRRER